MVSFFLDNVSDESVEFTNSMNPDFGNFMFYGREYTISRFDSAYVTNFILNAIINRISIDVANLEPMLEETNEFWDLIKNKPNAHQTWKEFIRYGASHFLLDGNVFLRLILNRNSISINNMHFIPQRDVTIIKDMVYGFIESFRINTYNGGQIMVNNYNEQRKDARNTVYKISDFSSMSRFACDLSPSDFLAVQNELCYVGMASKFNNSYLDNGAKPAYALKLAASTGYKARLTDKQKDELRETFQAKVGGKNNGKILVLEDGMDLQVISTDIDKLNFSENIKNAITYICMVKGVPPEILGISVSGGGSAYKVNEELRLFYMNNTVIPLGKTIYENLNDAILFRYNNKDTLGFDETKIPVLMNERYKIIESQTRGGVLTINEIRKNANLKPVDGGDRIMAELNRADINVPRGQEIIKEDSEIVVDK